MPSRDSQWKPGQSGNPGGAKKGLPRLVRDTVAGLSTEITHTDPETGEQITEMISGWEALAVKLFRIATGEDKDRVPAAKLLMDRAFGQAKAHVELTDGDPVKMPDMRGKTMDELRRIVAEGRGDGEPPDHVH